MEKLNSWKDVQYHIHNQWVHMQCICYSTCQPLLAELQRNIFSTCRQSGNEVREVVQPIKGNTQSLSLSRGSSTEETQLGNARSVSGMFHHFSYMCALQRDSAVCVLFLI